MSVREIVPWVSMVVVSHNDGAWLPRCVESLRQQTVFDRIELILVGDGPDYGTGGWRANWPRGWWPGQKPDAFGPGNAMVLRRERCVAPPTVLLQRHPGRADDAARTGQRT